MKLFHNICLAIFLTLTTVCQPTSYQQPGLLAPQYATSIRPVDFTAGPVVITQPGYYILTNDVIFEPSATDSFGNPFNAALIVLADCVTIDLNTHSIQQSSNFNSSKFKLIQLGGLNAFDTTDPKVYNPKHITIKNGCLNSSEGYGIYGKDNNNINIYNLEISACNIAGIFLENLQCSTIENCCISGSSLGAGNVYGIYLRDNDTTTPEWTSSSQGSHGPNGVTLKNLKVCNIHTNSSLDIATEITDLLCRAINKLNITDIINLQNCTTVSLQPLITSLINAVNALVLFLNIAKASPLPANIDQVIASKTAVQSAIDNLLQAINLLPNPTVNDLLLKAAVESLQSCFIIACDLITQANALSDGQKDFINGVETVAAWHAYGIRVNQGQGIILDNCNVSEISVDNSLPIVTRATAISLDACSSCYLTNCSTHGSSTNLGLSIGFSVATQSESNQFTNCISSQHTSNDESYGYWICQSHSQNIQSCQSSSNNAINRSKGFYLEQSNANMIKECRSFSHSCSNTATSQTIGFDSIGGDCNIFDTCQAYNLVGDKNFSFNSYEPELLVAGFRLKSYPDSLDPVVAFDTYSVITNSISRCLEGSGGNSSGILLDGAICSTIKKNTASTSRSIFNLGQTTGGNGYGIHDTASDTTALIVENIAYANQTLNYKVSYSLENEQLPLVQSTYGDMTSIFVASPWQNISLHANPGSTGCNQECMPNPEQTTT